MERRSTPRGDRRGTSNRRDQHERRVSYDRRAVLQDRRIVSSVKEAADERSGRELQDLLER
jgi:hypothetical protein